MTDYKQIIIAFLSTVFVIAALAGFVAWKNGELDRMTAVDEEAALDVDIPLAPKDDAPITPVPSVVKANEPINEANQTAPMGQNPIITFTTNKGDIGIELFMDRMPVTAGNFLTLVEKGYYDGIKFHRVIDGFMIQGGDPNTKTDNTATYGTGGPGYTIKDEFVPGLSNTRGTLSMANAGPNTGGSQFFINTVDNLFLDNKHPVFGVIVSGMDIVDAISDVAVNPNKLPLEAIVIEKAEVTN